MAERSPLPIYGNLIRFTLKNGTVTALSDLITLKTDEEFESSIKFNPLTKQVASNKFKIERTLGENVFSIKNATNTFSDVSIPIRTNLAFVQCLLKDTLNIQDGFSLEIPAANSKENNTSIVHSQPTDSLLKPMMHRSDNFFAEQSLLMVSNEFLGVMNDAKIIDTILKTDFKDLPQKPRWADGSGLSRYNLFTPQDFVSILNKMKNEFGMERIKEIFPTGGEGTLSSYYKKDSSFIYAKTGTLSGVVAISGFMYTSKNKLFLFSILVNNHQASATEVRRSIERFLQGVRKRY
jgi:D-alanyl-D-alanine carboxypeptidase/D-alanyl-D-alanine-endopeptidase (penicillin-binding protein 4)